MGLVRARRTLSGFAFLIMIMVFAPGCSVTVGPGQVTFSGDPSGPIGASSGPAGTPGAVPGAGAGGAPQPRPLQDPQIFTGDLN